eukprot:CAMPEP_0177667684 /NCGR_PEP_ID=MMETSP0447-20121125/22261_1 /TAXON_ID=0 /ORGANISM="Stygamoeba regulata, Strain BSH-02190019" /LENGTH=200 /DNA_ID=CAMNT_0019173945 /DNA_START=134 /DNA_END=732 /DNA_ORIENTATION=+
MDDRRVLYFSLGGVNRQVFLTSLESPDFKGLKRMARKLFKLTDGKMGFILRQGPKVNWLHIDSDIEAEATVFGNTKSVLHLDVKRYPLPAKALPTPVRGVIGHLVKAYGTAALEPLEALAQFMLRGGAGEDLHPSLDLHPSAAEEAADTHAAGRQTAGARAVAAEDEDEERESTQAEEEKRGKTDKSKEETLEEEALEEE